MEESYNMKIRVKYGSSEIEVQVPMTPRSELGVDRDGTGARAIEVIKRIIEQIKSLEDESN